MEGDKDENKEVERRGRMSSSRLLFSTRLPSPAKQVIIIIIFIIIPTAPRIPPHHPAQREERRGVMSLVGYLLSLLGCLVAKVLSVLSCSLAE